MSPEKSLRSTPRKAAAPSLTRTLYIAVEIIDRELGGALLLAAEAASRGWRVVVGGKQAIFNNMTRFRRMPGVFYLKSIVPGEVAKMKEILSQGHRIVSLDVEGLVLGNGEPGIRIRYGDETIDLADVLFFWGRHHYDCVHAVYPKIKDKAVISGSPIIDEIVIRGKKRPASDRKGGKARILVATSCGLVNHVNGPEFPWQMVLSTFGKNPDPQWIKAFEHLVALQGKVFEYFKEASLRIAETFKGCDVVLRPHPAENKEFWKAWLRRYPNVSIDERRPALEELLRCDVLVHFNSTLSLTSNILGIPSFMPIPEVEPEEAARITFVKDFSIIAGSVDDLVRKIGEYISDPNKPFARADISRYCENLSSDEYNASRIIVQTLEQRFEFSSAAGRIRSRSLTETVRVTVGHVKFFLKWVVGLALTTVRLPHGERFPPPNAYKNARTKQPNTSLEKVMRTMREIVEPQRLQQLSIERLATNLFVIKMTLLK